MRFTAARSELAWDLAGATPVSVRCAILDIKIDVTRSPETVKNFHRGPRTRAEFLCYAWLDPRLL